MAPHFLLLTPGRRGRIVGGMNDLGLSLDDFLTPRRSPPAFTLVRPLTAEDIEAAATILKSSKAPVIERPSERHHALARLLARGFNESEAGAMVGYGPAHVSILKASPAFQELIELYREKNDLEFAEFAGRLSGLGRDAILELQTRLENEPEKFTNAMLLELTTKLADRSGFGPTSKSEINVNVGLSQRLETARLRARDAALRDVTPLALDDLT